MTHLADTFTHKFGGWFLAPARRWANPDGTVGGIVADTAQIEPSVRVPSTSEVWPRANIGGGASIGYGANIGYGASIGPRARIGAGANIGEGAECGAEDWLFVLGPQGSRASWLTAVWSRKNGLRFWSGCKRGLTANEALAAIASEHGGSPIGDDYRYAIRTVVEHPGLARAMAAKAQVNSGGENGD